MKKIIAFAAVILMIFSLSACGEKKPTIIALDENRLSSEHIKKSLPFEAQYIRTYDGADSSDYPKTFLIKNRQELEKIFAEYGEKYDDNFFENHELIIVLLKEGSGSIRHEVEKVVFTQSADGKSSVQPVIKRIVPEVGTCDMAYWRIIIEIGKTQAETELLSAEIK